ncbi:hypothetical protein IW140_004477 [Coemansia sp. RSA 1813]|nr:hypothetical protein LPJ74_003611 [Coemansia sp. RSA 1843]KAJ2212766.1 hypothetical protein EV179_004419 [Coemansia sp. RSA 487]KAJ2567505.1 hypothetical protein IW140_004477 [Coemansia sp. RSA 1813]
MPVSSPVPDVDVPPVDVTTFLFEKAQVKLDALTAAGFKEPTLVVDSVSERAMCFSEIKRNAQAIARCLSSLIPMEQTRKNEIDTQGIVIDRAVLVLLQNDVMYSTVHFGILLAGCTHVALDPRLGAQELTIRLKEIGSTAVAAAFVDAQAVEALESATKIAGVKLPRKAVFIVADTDERTEHMKLDDMVQENIGLPFTPYPYTPEETATMPALVIYSSGTSGRAKGVVLTHRNILACNIMAGSYSARSSAIDIHDERSSQGRIISALSPWHIYGHCVLSYQPLTHGDCVVFLGEFGTIIYLEAIERYKITRVSATPQILHTLLNETTKVNSHTVRMRNSPEAEFHVDSVIAVGCGGASLPPTLKQIYSEYFGGAPVIVGYGQTESSSIIAGNSWDASAAPGAIGVLYPNSVAKVVDDKGNETDALGELCVAGPHVMKGYVGGVKSPIVDGFLHTGDYARLSADGHVYLRGRLADVVHTAQGVIVPTDVEAILADYPFIIDAAVVGVGAKGDAHAVVCLVLACSDVPKNELLADVRQIIRTRTGNPHIVCCEVSNIPKTLAGKILRNDLLNQIHHVNRQ